MNFILYLCIGVTLTSQINAQENPYTQLEQSIEKVLTMEDPKELDADFVLDLLFLAKKIYRLETGNTLDLEEIFEKTDKMYEELGIILPEKFSNEIKDIVRQRDRKQNLAEQDL